MRHCPSPPLLEARVRAAWQTPRAAADTTPGLLPALVCRRHELRPRFTAYYAQLRALPRRVRRALQRQWRLSLAGIALLLALGQSPGLAATIPVGDTCLLVDAITAANTDTATGGCPAGSGADTIVLPAGSTQTLTEVNNTTYYGPTGLPVVSSALTIVGNGSTLARASSAPAFRLLAVSPAGELTCEDLTLTGGLDGGGVLNLGALTVTRSTITGNAASGSDGGGISNFSGTLTLTNSTISGNSAFRGGGINTYSGTLTLTNSTISGNMAYGGGGISTYSGTLTLTNSTISGNTAISQGGGLENFLGTLTLTNSTISSNSSGDRGGGIDNLLGTLTLANSTVSGNASDSGGGIGNYNGTLSLVRTLVAGNTAPSGSEIYNAGSIATVLADNHNLFGVNDTAGVEGFSPGATDLVPPAGVQLPDILDPTLAFHGGFTQTHALVPGSPAIDAGGTVCTDATGDPLLTDQRGKPRVVDGNGDGTAACDIGAFEFFPIVNDFVTLDPALETAFDPTAVPGGPAGTFTITATFTNTSAMPLRVPFFRVIELSGGTLLLNADEGVQGVGATLTPDVGDSLLAPGEAVTVDFVVGLQTQAPFTFLVDLFGEPLP